VTEAWLMQVVREGLLLAVILSLPPLLASMAVGLLMGLLQAMTQLQESTLSFVPKMVAVFVALLLAGPWIFGQAARFAQTLFAAVPALGS